MWLIYALGAFLGGAAGLFFMLFAYTDAQKRYPVLKFAVPEQAEQDFLFHAWCDANSFTRQNDGSYRNGQGCLRSILEIRFDKGEMQLRECIDFVVAQRTFALNAPIILSRPIRQHQIRQLNKLLKHWNVPPVEWGKNIKAA